MKAIVLREAGCGPGALRLETVEDPVPGPGELIVRVRAAALNRHDLFITRGQYAGLDLAPGAGVDNGHFPIVLGNDGGLMTTRSPLRTPSTPVPCAATSPTARLGKRSARPGAAVPHPRSSR